MPFNIDFIGEKTIPIYEGETILTASLKAGIPHYHSCGGNARCSTCRVVVNRGAENLSAMNQKEAALREEVRLPANVRLACQTYVEKGDVAVHRIIRDMSDVDLYIDQSEIELDELGQEKQLVMLFLDIRDFTPFMEGSLPFDVIHLLRKLFSVFKTCIENGGGKIIETSGDGLYSVFGLDRSIGRAAENAIASSFAIFKELAHFNKGYVEEYFKHHFKIGIGMHCGKVIVGNIGLGINNNLTVMGLPVNIASRIQSATKDLNSSFLVSADVMNMTGADQYPSTLLSMKGIKDPMLVYLLGEPYYEASELTVSK